MDVLESDCDEFVAPTATTGADAALFLRRGEWLFLPRPWLRVAEAAVRVDQPLANGDGCALWSDRSHQRGSGASASVYVMGRVRGLRHESITLPYWHRAVRLETCRAV